ncbi:uroporphyrinogen decarboxylase/cobalamine-independent methonine synthase family protein [Desertihabitans aurantiacus]|uniref:methionine synthase n=1 Tax=Desertihabitans aurantiacus TaxID=2282477 RepID=UPI000DF8249C|nr:methionine synthase [Desertihabitans aurantiacus]
MTARATGIGSWPGTDPAGAIRLTLGELGENGSPGVPYLPELPDRGTHAGTTGRTAAMLVGLGLDLQPAGWRLTDAPGIDHRRAISLLRQDLDLLEEEAQGYTGQLTLTAAGPWTLAATVERPRGDRVLADSGARRELGESLAEGLGDLVAELRRRLPALTLTVQLDEPALPAVQDGRIGTASGFSRHRAVEPAELSSALETVTGAVRDAGAEQVALHCCAAGLDVRLVLDAGVGRLLLDVDQLTRADADLLAETLDAGRAEIGLGIQPTGVADAVLSPDRLTDRALHLLRPLELGPQVAERLLLTPACGLAGWTAGPATAVLRHLVRAAQLVTDELSR